jgi:hypothetical protein
VKFLLFSFLILGSLGALVAFVGCQDLDKLLVGGSKGTLVAAPGMTFDEVKARSSLKLDGLADLGDEKVIALSDAAAFDFELAGTGIRFERCRYYALWNKKPDPGISYILLQATKNVSWAAIKKELLKTQEKLKADGWTPVTLEDGKNAAERLKDSLSEPAPAREIGFKWKKGDLALVFSARRFPQTITGENPDVGEPYNQELDIRKEK